MADIQTADLNATIAALQGDLTAIPLSDAIALIDSWQQQLQGNDIAEDLGELKQAIQSGDTATIAEILSDLGEDTSEAAADTTGDVAVKVEQLGELLSQAGAALQ